MKKKVEQINKNGDIVFDYDNILRSKEILNKIENNIKNINNIKISKQNKFFSINYKNKNINLYIKNLTYLGNPHPFYKKRFQLGLNPDELKNYLNGSLYLIGIYSYKNNLTFVLPELNHPEKRLFNNSSIIHVYTTDLIESNKFGNFKKIDKNNNNIYLFQNFNEMLDFILNQKFDYKNLLLKEIDKFISKKIQPSQVWYGKNCYDEMIKKNFKMKFFSEWIGAYFEYSFYEYLNENNISENLFKYLNIKNNSEIFDLWISNSYYGDLKTHSINSSDILGNDLQKVHDSIKKYNKLWLITLTHNPTSDKEFDYNLTKYWNKLQNKLNEDSYKDRMKNRTLLTKVEIFEINKENIKYLQIFKQGKNSDKKSLRQPKIKINDKDFENFIIYRKFLNNN